MHYDWLHGAHKALDVFEQGVSSHLESHLVTINVEVGLSDLDSRDVPAVDQLLSHLDGKFHGNIFHVHVHIALEGDKGSDMGQKVGDGELCLKAFDGEDHCVGVVGVNFDLHILGWFCNGSSDPGKVTGRDRDIRQFYLVDDL